MFLVEEGGAVGHEGAYQGLPKLVAAQMSLKSDSLSTDGRGGPSGSAESTDVVSTTWRLYAAGGQR